MAALNHMQYLPRLPRRYAFINYARDKAHNIFTLINYQNPRVMKKMILTAALIISLSIAAFAQYSYLASTYSNVKGSYQAQYYSSNYNYNEPDDSATVVKDSKYYKQVSRNQKIASYCFLGVGAAVVAIGFVTFPDDGVLFTSEKAEKEADQATTITCIGAALMLGSIPFTIVSGINRRKAKILMQAEKTGAGIPIPNSSSVTGLTISISLGRHS